MSDRALTHTAASASASASTASGRAGVSMCRATTAVASKNVLNRGPRANARSRRTPLHTAIGVAEPSAIVATRRHERSGGDEGVDRHLGGGVLDRAEDRRRPAADGDDEALPAGGAAQLGGQVPAQLTRADPRSVHVYTSVRTASCTSDDPSARSSAMNFAFTDEQDELRKIVRSFLEAKSPESAVREQMETERGYDEAVWSQMAEQMGLQGLHIPEEYGGSGFSYVELGIVLEEMGRALLCAPFFSTVVLAANTLIQCGDEAAKKDYLPGIASGETIATVAFTEPSGKWDESGIEMEATKIRRRLHADRARRCTCSTGTSPTCVLVVARTAAGVSLFAVDGDAAGLTRTPLSTMDQTRKQARLEFENTPARLIESEGIGWDFMARVLDLVAVGLAAEQVGGAQKVLEMAVEYAKVRVQFGRPIGSFQAIKHKCADMLLEVESAKSAAYYGMWCAAEMDDELPSVASLAKAYCSEAYFHAAAENIQIHGGIGFTWEHPAHLYFKRAKSSELLFGDPTYHRELLAQRIGI